MKPIIRFAAFLLVMNSHGLMNPRSSKSISIKSLPPQESLESDTTDRTVRRQRWGIDNTHDEEYWFNTKIHTLGNTGFNGALHAAMAPFATHLIDNVAYDGINIRESVARELAKSITTNKARIVDLCCGVGLSTRALQVAFPDAVELIGVDTSPEMISMANFLRDHQCHMQPIADMFKEGLAAHSKSLEQPLAEFFTNVFKSVQIPSEFRLPSMKVKRAFVKAKRAITKFTCANAEETSLPDSSFDLVTIMYAFHEAPQAGRDKILAEARRLLHKGGVLALIDISPDYQPTPTMLAGEPYVIEYQKNIDRQLRMLKGFTKATFKSVVPGHVGVWLLNRV